MVIADNGIKLRDIRENILTDNTFPNSDTVSITATSKILQKMPSQ